MIKLVNVSKTYQDGSGFLFANKNVNLEIDQGMTSIIGKSGSGKTTLLSILGGLLKPNEGNVFVFEKDIFSLNEKQLMEYRNKTIGFVFQEAYLEDSYSVYENVELPTLITKIKKEERIERVMRSLKKVDMDMKAKSFARVLSGGEKQRVAIARALVNNPQILLCDEPTGNLDEINGNIIMEHLMKISREGIIVILVTHNVEYAKMADKIYKMHSGELE